jgi:hypothetical protein
MILGDLAVDWLDGRRIRENAAGGIASHARTGTGKLRAPRHCAGNDAGVRKRNADGQCTQDDSERSE